jgi:glycosyltransferase involved in cell wall biosynthesis
VFVTSEPDKKYFKNAVVVKGGVTLGEKVDGKGKYDAVFVGRLHYQKGVFNLIEIWKQLSKKGNFRLAVIGQGVLESEFKKRIKCLNIDFLGYKNGKEKYDVFKQSKVFIHPAIFDSGGMACAEAMAWGIPAVGYNLEAFKTYCAIITCENTRMIVENVYNLITDSEIWKHASNKAYEYIKDNWTWEKRAEEIWKELFLILEQETSESQGQSALTYSR